MPIHIPHLMEPFSPTVEQMKAYLAQQEAGIEYVTAYSETIGWFAMFSPKKNRKLKEARKNYHEKVQEYFESLEKK